MSQVSTGKQFFGHPRGLATLFFTEMWERFSYYGMRALLILFMVDAARGGFGMSESEAGAIYGLYTFGVYALCLPGGWIADRLIGQRKAVLWGGIIIALGHYVLAIPSKPSFFAGLVLVAIGTGLLKPNVSAIVGDLYADKGPKRDAGFSIFYMGINIGAFLGPWLCSLLGEKVDWHLGFSAAGVGMTLAVIQYVLGKRHLEGCGELKEEFQEPAAIGQARKRFTWGIVAILAGIGALIATNATGATSITVQSFADASTKVVVVLAAVYFFWVITLVCKDASEKKRVGLIALLFVGAACFWSGFEQAGSTMNLFAKENTDLTIFGWEMPAGWLQNVNPFLIIVLAPVVGMVWVWLGDRNPSLGAKFGVGLILLGVGFFVMAWGSQYIDEGKVSPMWLVTTYFFHTVGELTLSPVGLSSVTKLSPSRLVGQMMGTWFMGAALGNLIAGLMTGRLETVTEQELFTNVAIFAGVAGLVFLALAIPTRKLAGGIK